MLFVNWFSEMDLSSIQGKLILSAVFFGLIWVLKTIAIRYLTQHVTDITTRYRWRKNITYIIYGIGLFSIIFIWSDRFASLATFLGLLSAGLAIAFKDPIVNVAGWYYLLINRPYRVGDRIEIEQMKGDVIDISLFRTTMIEVGNWVNAEQSTGRIIHVPNSKVFTVAIQNYTELINHIWNEISISLTADSNWEAAKKILENIAQNHTPPVDASINDRIAEISEKYFIMSAKHEPVIYTKLAANGCIVLTLRYMCMVKQRRTSEHQITEALLHELKSHNDIRLANQVMRILSE